MQNAWDSPRIIQNISIAIEKTQIRFVPVIWVQHPDHELVYGSHEWQFVSELLPVEGEVQIHK